MTRRAVIRAGEFRLVGTSRKNVWAEPCEIIEVEGGRVLVCPLEDEGRDPEWVARRHVLKPGTVDPRDGGTW